MAETYLEGEIAILGGTGDQGRGLALRFAKAGRTVLIGSRDLERAETAAEEIRVVIPQSEITGCENPAAAERARIVILSIPFEHTVIRVKSIRGVLKPGQIVVSMGVPLSSSTGGAAHPIRVGQGSCAELVQSLVPDGVHVVSAFQNVSARRLAALDEPVDCDVVVSGSVEPRGVVMALCDQIPGLRGVDGGPLSNSRITESITALLIGMNIRYGVSRGLGIRFTGLPDRDS